MSTELVTVQHSTIEAGVLERVLLGGDLSHLAANERLQYYRATCESLGLNPLTKPFDYLQLDNKLVLYAKRDCADQLRKIHDVSVKIIDRELVDGVYVVKAQARMPNGREDESIGAVPLVKESGEWKKSPAGKSYFQSSGEFTPMSPNDRANSVMKAETKAKRRVTLSICGLGMLDESELDTIAGARTAPQAEPPAPQDLAPTKPLVTPQEPQVPGPVMDMYRKMAAEKRDGFNAVFANFRQQFEGILGEERGSEEYTRLLNANGVGSWQEFKAMGPAKKCVLQMHERLLALEPAIDVIFEESEVVA